MQHHKILKVKKDCLLNQSQIINLMHTRTCRSPSGAEVLYLLYLTVSRVWYILMAAVFTYCICCFSDFNLLSRKTAESVYCHFLTLTLFECDGDLCDLYLH